MDEGVEHDQRRSTGRGKVGFALEVDHEGSPPAGSEGMWAESVGGGRYRVDNMPWFVRGLACGDVVEAQPDEAGVLWATAGVSWSGRLAIRVIPFRAGSLGGSVAAVLEAFDLSISMTNRRKSVGSGCPRRVSKAWTSASVLCPVVRSKLTTATFLGTSWLHLLSVPAHLPFDHLPVLAALAELDRVLEHGNHGLGCDHASERADSDEGHVGVVHECSERRGDVEGLAEPPERTSDLLTGRTQLRVRCQLDELGGTGGVGGLGQRVAERPCRIAARRSMRPPEVRVAQHVEGIAAEPAGAHGARRRRHGLRVV